MNTEAKAKPKSTRLTLTEHAVIPIDEAGAHVAALNAKYKGVVYDCNDKTGMEQARAARVEIRESRYAIEKARAGRVTELTKASKAVSARAAELTAPLVEVETPIHTMIVTVEERLEAEKNERDRLAAERASAQQAILRSIEALPGRLFGASVAELQAGLDEIAAINVDELDDLFKTAATIAIEEVSARLTQAIATRAELDRQAELLREQQRQIEENLRAQQAELDRQREEQERQLSLQREEQERALAAQREEADRINAEKQKQLDAERAEAERENQARQAELDRQAEAQREVRLRQEREDEERRQREIAEQLERDRIAVAERVERERVAEEARITEEEHRIRAASLIEAANLAEDLLCELGARDHLVTRMLRAALERTPFTA